MFQSQVIIAQYLDILELFNVMLHVSRPPFIEYCTEIEHPHSICDEVICFCRYRVLYGMFRSKLCILCIHYAHISSDTIVYTVFASLPQQHCS